MWIAFSRPYWVFGTMCLVMGLILDREMHMSKGFLSSHTLIFLSKSVPICAGIHLTFLKWFLFSDQFNPQGITLSFLHLMCELGNILMPIILSSQILIFVINPLKMIVQILIKHLFGKNVSNILRSKNQKLTQIEQTQLIM